MIIISFDFIIFNHNIYGYKVLVSIFCKNFFFTMQDFTIE